MELKKKLIQFHHIRPQLILSYFLFVSLRLWQPIMILEFALQWKKIFLDLLRSLIGKYLIHQYPRIQLLFIFLHDLLNHSMMKKEIIYHLPFNLTTLLPLPTFIGNLQLLQRLKQLLNLTPFLNHNKYNNQMINSSIYNDWLRFL